MQTIGMAATALAGLIVLMVLVLVVVSLPDIARYRRIRGM